jgi:hypothetical protein
LDDARIEEGVVLTSDELSFRESKIEAALRKIAPGRIRATARFFTDARSWVEFADREIVGITLRVMRARRRFALFASC